MIFLKNKYFIFYIIPFVCFSLFSCSSNKAPQNDNIAIEATSQPFTERNVESTDGTFIYDNAGLLGGDDLSACNNYAGWLYKNKLINSAVITVNDLEGMTPYDYAAEKYGEIYEGKGSGLIILINNASNEDIVYRTGSCLTNIGETSVDNAIYWATKDIVKNDYRRGIMRMLQLGELCPEHMIDNAQIFAYEDIKDIEKKLSKCKTDTALIATRNGSDTPNEEILKTYYNRKYGDNKGIMLMFDINTRTFIAYSADKLPSDLEKALKTANGLASKEDYVGAINKLIEAMGK